MHPLKKNRPLRRVVLASAATVSGLVLLLSMKPHTSPALATANSKSPTVSSSSAPAGGPSSGPQTGSRTITGDTVQTRWGPVQVRVEITDGRLTEVTAVDYPRDNPRDQEINSYAIPRLRREALAAQSADIDMVSGATYTSAGYQQSLQSALDSAAS